MDSSTLESLFSTERIVLALVLVYAICGLLMLAFGINFLVIGALALLTAIVVNGLYYSRYHWGRYLRRN